MYPHSLFRSAMSLDGRVLCIRFGFVQMYLCTGSRNVRTFFGNACGLDFRSPIVRAALRALGMPPCDIKQLSEGDEGGRLFGKLKEVYHSVLLRSQSVSWLGHKWNHELLAKFDSPCRTSTLSPPSKEWVVMPVYQFLRDQMVLATAMTFAGPRFISECPTISRDLWDFDAALVMMGLGAPRFMCRRGWDARTRVFGAASRWLMHAREGFAYRDKSDKSSEWEENFGHRVMRERDIALEACGVSPDGRAALALGLIFAANVNSVPIAGWMALHILEDPDLYRRVFTELMAADIVSEPAGEKYLDMSKLQSLPLLLSIYQECLRRYTSLPLNRQLRTNVEIDGYHLPAGSYVMAPSYPAHYNERAWSTPEHPANTFWAERFIHTRPSFGDFYPYGGGVNICPGRLVSKNQILAAVILLLTEFEFEFVQHADEDGQPISQGPNPFDSEKYGPRGVARPNRDLLVRMRRARTKSVDSMANPGK